MCDRSVAAWLTSLRNTVESYDNFEPVYYYSDEDFEFDDIDDTTINNYGDVEDNSEEVEFYSSEDLYSEIKDDDDDDEERSCSEMDLSDERYESGEYMNLWECSTPKKNLLDLSFGNVCRVSTVFNESLEVLQVEPIAYERVQVEVGKDVECWMENLRRFVEEEEEEEVEMENEQLLSNFRHGYDDEKSSSIEKLEPFPVNDSSVELRQNSATRDQVVRSKTYIQHAPEPRTAQISLKKFEVNGSFRLCIGEDCCVKIKAGESLKYDNGQFSIVRAGHTIDKFTKDVSIFKTQTYKIQDKVVELKDSHNRTCSFYFDDHQSANNFAKNNETFTRKRPNSVNDKSSSIKSMLMKLLGKRQSREELISRGILKAGDIFGNSLADIYYEEKGVPKFITETIKIIEKEENIKTMGLYRTSGNLATVQNIRCEINNKNYRILKQYENDVDVLSGALKMFFRELQEPLLPSHILTDMNGIKGKDLQKDKWREIITALDEPNRETLFCLINHLLKVAEYKEYNKMDFYNISVCWSPSLFSMPIDCHNILERTTNAKTSFEFLLEYYQENRYELKKDLNDNTTSTGTGTGTPRSARKYSKEPAIGIFKEESTKIEKLIKLIEQKIETEGLYVKSAPSSQFHKYYQRVLNGKDLEKYEGNIYNVTDALKKYIKELKNPFIPEVVLDNCMEICDERTKDMQEEIYGELARIPHKVTLKLLIDHLIKVVDQKSNDLTRERIVEMWTLILTYYKHRDENPDSLKIYTKEKNYLSYKPVISEIFEHFKRNRIVTRSNKDGGKDISRRVSHYDNQ